MYLSIHYVWWKLSRWVSTIGPRIISCSYVFLLCYCNLYDGFIFRRWNRTCLGKKMSFARDRLMENALWPIGQNFKPQLSNFRRNMTVVNALITVVDDVYDVYGTLDELEIFTDAIERLIGSSWSVHICIYMIYSWMPISFLKSPSVQFIFGGFLIIKLCFFFWGINIQLSQHQFTDLTKLIELMQEKFKNLCTYVIIFVCKNW